MYNHNVPTGKTVYSVYIVKVLQELLWQLNKKRPNLETGGLFLHWNDASVHSSKLVEEYLAKRGVQIITHPPPTHLTWH